MISAEPREAARISMAHVRSVAGRLLVDLKELSFDRPDPCHQAIQLGEESSLILHGLFHEVRRPAVMDPVQGIGQLAIQELHALLQIDKLLAKLALLDHRRQLG
jgi:hypothetical protein